jgi:GDP-L-fucose synthase
MIQKVVQFNGTINWDPKMPNGTPRKILDSTNIRNLGWKPKIVLEEGIKQTYEWFTSNLNHRR